MINKNLLRVFFQNDWEVRNRLLFHKRLTIILKKGEKFDDFYPSRSDSVRPVYSNRRTLRVF